VAHIPVEKHLTSRLPIFRKHRPQTHYTRPRTPSTCLPDHDPHERTIPRCLILNMSSDRPLTSLPPEESEKPNQDAEEKLSGPKIQPYVPHLFDLVNPIRRAENSAKLYIPRTYLQSEAVDASLLLGHGASFTASRQTLPQGEVLLRETADMVTWTNEKVVAAPRRPKYVVYKSARVSFEANGEPSTVQDRRALQSVLTEFHALLHPTLLKHPNIIDFLALAWGSSPFEPLHRLPVLVVEYADQGTLADLQVREKALPDQIKHSLCLGIAQGLSALHQNGIVHGDVKPENILICSHSKETFIAKLADFGFAIIETVEASEILIGGTRTWRAPEASAPVSQSLLRKTDVYSFGLLTWSVAIDGGNPFNIFIPDSVRGEERLLAMDLLKEHDEVVELSKFDHWIFRSKVLTELQSRLPSMDANSRGLISMVSDLERVQKALVGLSEEPVGLSAQLAAQREQLSSLMCQLYRTKAFYKGLESLFQSTLRKDPNSRNLDAAIGFLRDGHDIQRLY
jgi:serine/threonine protein kinase